MRDEREYAVKYTEEEEGKKIVFTYTYQLYIET